jgi:hypothetical protein
MDFMSAYSDLESLQAEAFTTTSKMGHAGRVERNEYITPEIKQAEARISAMEKAGRNVNGGSSPASFAVGTDYIPGTGFNLNHQGERIIPSDQNERITRALESPTKMPAQATSMGDVHLHVHAIDAKGVSQFLDKYKHNIRAAFNDSYAENSGGGMN